jgi:glycosyltransferase involved in cell wall biosynthesis
MPVTVPDSLEWSDIKVGVAILSFEAERTIEEVTADVCAATADIDADVLVADDHSSDETYDRALSVAARLAARRITVLRNADNLGYGGNQRVAISWARDRNLDVLVLVHGDGQHLAREIPALVRPIVAGDADGVMGSRTMVPGAARRGGMPMHRFVANRSLSFIQNRLAGTDFAEWHSGFRAYRVGALDPIELDELPSGFDVDCAMTLALLGRGSRLVEVPCTTWYGDEVSRVRLVRYGVAVLVRGARHRLGRRDRERANVTALDRAGALGPR